MERSGHISAGGVQAYEWTTDKQHQAVSQVLSGPTRELVPPSETESTIGELASSSTKESAIGEVVSSVKEEPAPVKEEPAPVKEEPAPVDAVTQRISEAAGIVKRQLHFQDLTGCTVNINMNF